MAEGKYGLVEVEPVGSREGVLAIVGGVRLVMGKPENEATDVRVAIGGVGDGRLITPGLRLEDAFTASGGAGELLNLELARALGWLAADESLGLVALCGPLSSQVYGGPTQYRRDAGYLDGGWGLTRSGWWRLAYEAEQGVGRQEGHRSSLLKKMSDYHSNRDPRGDRRMHVRHTQALVLKLRRQEDLVPLGVEYSALGQHFLRELTIRADALMVSPDGGKLVWVEWLRKKENAYSAAWQQRFVAKRKAMVDVANAIGRPVEFYVDYPLGLKRRGVVGRSCGDCWRTQRSPWWWSSTATGWRA